MKRIVYTIAVVGWLVGLAACTPEGSVGGAGGTTAARVDPKDGGPGPDAASPQDSPGPITTEGLSGQLDSILENFVDAELPGVALLVVHDGHILHARGYGLADVEAAREITPMTSMRMGSVSKQFTALAAVTLAADGTLSLDDPVRKHFDAAVFEGITIKHLLQHTSGLAEYFEVFQEEWDRSKVAVNDDVVGWYMDNDPEGFFAPGEDWKYSNGGYSVLASIVAKTSGQSLPELTRSRIFGPLGMSSSLFFNLAEPEPIPSRAFCYSVEEGEASQVDGNYLNGIVGEGGLYTTLLDYARWDQALFGDELVPRQWIAEAFRPAVLSSGEVVQRDSYESLGYGPMGYGYGWGVSLRDDDRVVVHAGGWYGTRTLTIRHIDVPYTIAIFSNNGSIDPEAIAKEVEKAVRTGLGL